MALIRSSLAVLYSCKPLPWKAILSFHRLILFITPHFLAASTRRHLCRLRVLCSSLPCSTWPTRDKDLDAAFVVYVIWSPWFRPFYVGKSIDFHARVRRHLNGLLSPATSAQQPYMVYVTSKAGGCASKAVAPWFFTPIVCCSSDEEALNLEQRLISTLQPRLNAPFVNRLLVRVPTFKRFVVQSLSFSSRPPRPPKRFHHSRRHPQQLLQPESVLACAKCDPSVARRLSVERWAAGASNVLSSPSSGQVRQELFTVTSAEWFDVWKIFSALTKAPRTESVWPSWRECGASASGPNPVPWYKVLFLGLPWVMRVLHFALPSIRWCVRRVIGARPYYYQLCGR